MPRSHASIGRLTSDRTLHPRFDQCLVDQPYRIGLGDPIDGGRLASEAVERQLERIALAEAAAGTVAQRLQIADHFGQRGGIVGLDLRQVLLRAFGSHAPAGSGAIRPLPCPCAGTVDWRAARTGRQTPKRHQTARYKR